MRIEGVVLALLSERIAGIHAASPQRTELRLRSRTHYVDGHTYRIYIRAMEFTWSEAKRAANLKAHGLDFVDVLRVFGGLTYSYEDDRFSYAEQRFITLGLLAGTPVSIVHTETEYEIRVISFRKATSREAAIFFNEVQD